MTRPALLAPRVLAPLLLLAGCPRHMPPRQAGGLAMDLATRDSVALVTLQNVGRTPLRVLTHVEADRRHFDWNVLHLRDAAGHERTIVPSGDRDESWPVTADLPAGGATVQEIDVAEWAAEDGPGLAPGVYQLTVEYEVGPDAPRNVWHGHLSAGPVSLQVR